MPDLQLADVESTNLHMLCVIRLAVEQDRVTASSRFALSAALADRLLSLNHDQLWAVVTHVGPTTLFPPREDLLALLQAPLPLTGPLAAVQAARPPATDAKE